MITIQVYDPPMCCPTGLCGPQLDPELVHFAAMLSKLKSLGVRVERYNLSQQPLAFVQNPAVQELLRTGGPEALPVLYWNGVEKLRGRYPDRGERPLWIAEASGVSGAS